jgi:hypothetical protein
MDATDQARALIARNQALLVQAAEARRQAREAVVRAEQRVQQAIQAQLAAERALRFVAPPFTMPGEAIKRLNGDAA